MRQNPSMRFVKPVLYIVLVLVAFPIAAFALEDARLDPNVSPARQTISLELDANQTEYRGSVRIELDVKESTRTFRFHAEEMTLDKIELQGTGTSFEVTHDTKENGLVYAETQTKLQPGRYTLTIEFHKDYNTRAVGLYRMEKDETGYIYTQFEAVDARKAFPCWDEPEFKIPFQVTVRVPEDHEAVFNTPVETTERAEGFKTITYYETKPLPTYLLAFAVGPMESIEIEGLSVPGRVYAPKGQAHLAKLAAEFAPPILVALEEYFGRPYPYRKLDLIGIPEYWPGAMENPGAVTFADGLLLIDSESASVSQRRRLALSPLTNSRIYGLVIS